ncbi:MAG: glycosyltransferase [Povalibacter sp.]
MRLTVVTHGSEGDTRPLAALCRGLLDRGHELLLFADESTLSLPRKLGVPSQALSGDLKATLPIGDPKQEIRISDVLQTAKKVKAVITSNAAAWLRQVGDHARDSDAILFSSLAAGIGNVLRDEFKKPGCGLFFQPLTPTREFSSPMLPPLNLPGWAKRATFKASLAQMWSTCGRPAENARVEVFGHRRARRDLDFPILYCISRELVRQPADWPSNHLICGHWSMRSLDVEPSAELQDFLAAGEPPIYAGFGSPSGFIRVKALSALVDAVAGRRAVFGPGWSAIDSSVLPKNFFVARDIAHEWLFPRMSVVIHHGGAGTTHTAARAGVPQIVLPIAADHYFWSSRVAARGVAPKYARGARLNSQAIARMIEFTQRPDVRANARDLGEAMSREQGVANAIEAIEQLPR